MVALLFLHPSTPRDARYRDAVGSGTEGTWESGFGVSAGFLQASTRFALLILHATVCAAQVPIWGACMQMCGFERNETEMHSTFILRPPKVWGWPEGMQELG